MTNRILLLLFGILMSITCSYAELSKVIEVTTPGMLYLSLGDDKTKVTELIITGTINDADFTTIKQMSLLKVLDMLNVDIVSGAIPNGAFLGRTMDEIILPSSLESIGVDAFKLSSGNIDFSNCTSLTSIQDRAFMETKMALDFTHCKSLQNFGAYCFWYAQGNVTLPDNLEALSAFTFQNFRGSVDFSSSLKSIGAGAFLSSSFSRPIVLPSSLESIGVDAFKLSSGNIDFSNCTSLTSIQDRAFMETKMALDFTHCKSLQNFGAHCFWYAQGNVTLPDNLDALSAFSFQNFRGSVDLGSCLKTIGSFAFGNSTIKDILLPASVQSIASDAFKGCSKLESITSLNSIPPVLEINVFAGVNKTTCKLYVPKGSIELYKAAAQWTEFFDMNSVIPSKVDLTYKIGIGHINGTH